MEILAVFVVVVAAVARYFYANWQVWAAWAVVSVVVFIAMDFSGFEEKKSLAIVIVSSILGFLLPEFWQAFRTFLSRPRNTFLFIVLICLCYGLLFEDQRVIQNSITVIIMYAICYLAIKWIWRKINKIL